MAKQPDDITLTEHKNFQVFLPDNLGEVMISFDDPKGITLWVWGTPAYDPADPKEWQADLNAPVYSGKLFTWKELEKNVRNLKGNLKKIADIK